MKLTTRVLPVEEWGKLAGTELGSQLPVLEPDENVTRIFVVEDGERIVGCWAALRFVHAEGVWIDPVCRRGVAVQRRLLQFMKAQAVAWGQPFFVTGAETPDVAQLITDHLHGVPISGSQYVVSVRG